jgi:hypothetical protein
MEYRNYWYKVVPVCMRFFFFNSLEKYIDRKSKKSSPSLDLFAISSLLDGPNFCPFLLSTFPIKGSTTFAAGGAAVMARRNRDWRFLFLDILRLLFPV